MWTVYLLKFTNGHIYVGSTNDLERRLKSYDAGQVQSTRGHLPFELKSHI